MSLFHPRPTTTEQAVAPLRTMLEDLKEIQDARTRRIDNNDATIQFLRNDNTEHGEELKQSVQMQQQLRRILGEPEFDE